MFLAILFAWKKWIEGPHTAFAARGHRLMPVARTCKLSPSMAVSTRVTNAIRHLLDDRLPRRLRDSAWFMAPLFFVWCKGRMVGSWMRFKELAPTLSITELRELYRRADSLGAGRPTDTHPAALSFVLDQIDPTARSLLDVGSGRGYFLERLQADRRFASLSLTGCDLLEQPRVGRARQVVGDHEALPFADAALDIVTCMHTLEHARDFSRTVTELRRVCRAQLVIVVPCQKYFRYTMDMHLQFFPEPASLARAIGVAEGEIRRFGDDLLYVWCRVRADGQED